MPGPFIAVVLICALLAAAIAEIHSIKRWNIRADLRCEINMRLTEPGEVATLSYQIRNTAPWPLPSVSVAFYFDDAVELLDGDDEDRSRNRICIDTAIMPHRVCRGTIRIAFRERGLHKVGRVYLETGDFLGLHPVIRALDLPFSVICTAKRAEEQPKFAPLGGFIGDISVRRFIMDDPSIVLGYREYTGTEPLKDVSWTQTARTGRLMVKLHDFTVESDVAILVDVESVPKESAERCLSLVRTVCDELEQAKIPYVVLSNGDLQFRDKGVGRGHCFEIQRRIGLCAFVRYAGFRHLLADCAAGGNSRGYIIVAPEREAEIDEAIARLCAATGTQVCLLTGKEGTENA